MCMTEKTLPEISGWILDYINEPRTAEDQLAAVRTLQDFLHEVEHTLVVRVVEERHAHRINGAD